MQIYKVFDSKPHPVRAHFAGSLTEAHTHAKFIVSRDDARIELFEVPTDKAALLLYLNDQVDNLDLEPLRTWSLTERGGLKELANGD